MAEKENEEILEEVETDTPAEEIPEESAASGVEDKITAAEDKAKAAEDKYLRLYAEFDNYKKRTQREKDARYADAVIDTVLAFLPVADSLERALAVEVENDDDKKALLEYIMKGQDVNYEQIILNALWLSQQRDLADQVS